MPRESFANIVNLIIDNKAWDFPSDARARAYLMRQKIRGHLRTPAEGIQQEFTKPNVKRHRLNPGGSLMVCAGIVNCRVAVWSYVDGRWNGETAANMYKDVLLPAMARRRGRKTAYRALADNDPTGYKSTDAAKMKQECGITASSTLGIALF